MTMQTARSRRRDVISATMTFYEKMHSSAQILIEKWEYYLRCIWVLFASSPIPLPSIFLMSISIDVVRISCEDGHETKSK